MSIDEEAHYQNREKEGNIKQLKRQHLHQFCYEDFYSPKCCKINNQIKALLRLFNF